MQALFVGNFAPAHSTENDLRRELESMGHSVWPMPENNANVLPVIAQRAAQADLIVWVHTPAFGREEQTASALTGHRAPVVAIHLDLYRGLDREDRVRGDRYFSACSVVYTADGGAPAGWWEARGVNHRWSPPGVLSDSCYLAEPDHRQHPAEIVFVGARNYHPEHPRAELVAWLQAEYGARFKLYEHNSAMRQERLNVLYASASVAVGDSCFAGRASHPRYVSDRLFEAGGRGALQVFPRIEGVVGGPSAMMVEGEHLLGYDASDRRSLRDAIARALSLHGEEATAMRRRSVAHVAAHHTYRHRLEAILDGLKADGLLS